MIFEARQQTKFVQRVWHNMMLRSIRTAACRRNFGVCMFVFLLLIPTALKAQVGNADVLGTVTDPTGAVLQNANVTVHNLRTGVDRTAITNARGEYTISILPNGQYALKVEASGFKTYSVPSFTLDTGDRMRLDAKLATGTVTEEVKVEATAEAALQTDSSTVSNTLDEKQTQDLPLNNRNFAGALALMPGVQLASTSGSTYGVADRRPSADVNINGQLPAYNNNMVDGFDNNERDMGFAGVRPSIDGISEMAVDTSVFRAEVGRAGGGAINLVTKSGSNSLHGALFEYLRNEDLNAMGRFNTTNPEYRQNIFGGNVGGPVILPKLYHGKNKTFFFFDYEQSRLLEGQSSTISLPTRYELLNPGDFSDINTCYSYDHSSPSFVGAGPIISSSTKLNIADPTQPQPLNSSAVNLWHMIPMPNKTPTSTSGVCSNTANGTVSFDNATPTNNYYSANPETQNSKTWSIRVDHHFSDRDQLFARFADNPVYTYFPGIFPEITAAAISAGVYSTDATPFIGMYPGGNSGSFPGPSNTVSRSMQLDYVHIFNPNLIMDLKAGYSRISVITEPLNYGINAAEKLGIPNVVISGNATTDVLPQWGISQGVAIGSSNSIPSINIGNNFQYTGSLTYTHNNHTFKFGAGMIRRQLEAFTNQEGGGSFTSMGNSWPYTSFGQFLTAFAGVELRSVDLAIPHFQAWEPSFYGQDDWRVNSKLTLNLGLRYDIYTPWTEADGRQSNFDLSNLKYILAKNDKSVNCSTCEFSSTMGVSTRYNDVSPRVGFAYSITPKTVLRGGYGLSWYPLEIGSGTAGSPTNMIANPNAPYVFSYSYTPGSSNYTAPYWGNGPIVPVLVDVNNNLTTDSNSFVGNSQVTQINIRPKTSRAFMVQQINMTLQRQFGDYSVTAGYVGVISHGLGRGINANQPDPPGANQAEPGYLYAKELPYVQALAMEYNGANGNYNSLTLVMGREFRNGLRMNANYTWAHGLDSTWSGTALWTSNPGYDYGNSSTDIRQRIVGTASYTLPFASNSNGVKRLLLKGWQPNLIFNWNSAAPFEVDYQIRGGGTLPIGVPGLTSDRPNIVANPYLKHKTLANWINIAAFENQTQGTAGNEAKNALHVGNYFTNVDLSLMKDFAVNEKLKFQFRAEGYNVLNHTNLGQPDNGLSDTNFGQVSTITGNPRQMQMALKLLF